MPYVEGFLYLLLTGDLPTQADAEEVAGEFRARATVPTAEKARVVLALVRP